MDNVWDRFKLRLNILLSKRSVTLSMFGLLVCSIVYFSMTYFHIPLDLAMCHRDIQNCITPTQPIMVSNNGDKLRLNEANYWLNIYRTRYLSSRNTLGEMICQHAGVGVQPNGAWCLSQAFASREHNTDKGLASGLIQLLHDSSVVDFGCGLGTYGALMLAADKNISWDGYDGSENIFTFTQGRVKWLNLAEAQFLGRTYDWSVCMEVGEHLPSQYQENLLGNLHRHNRKGIVVSWAIPGQGGLGHVNPKTPEDTISMFSALGYVYDEGKTTQLRIAATALYWKKELFVFLRK
jgi:2-polyprenyl-3-methyl-5-hydroxy-6-metoxy-1,4-benzoquinol methylase